MHIGRWFWCPAVLSPLMVMPYLPGSEISVEDSGPGFSPADENEPHVALANIRERLELMCGGTLTIHSGTCGGTVVTITAPERKNGV